MIGKKDLIANLFNKMGLLNLPSFSSNDHFVVINYHRIRSLCDHRTFFDEEVFGPDQAEFEKQVKWLSMNYDVLSEADLISIIKKEFNFPSKSVMVTFDDGYIDNYTLAYPILKEYNVPAIFFIPTKSIEERHLGWWDLISYFLKNCEKNEISIENKRFVPKNQLKEAIDYILYLISYNIRELSYLVNKLQESCDVQFPDKDIQDSELMTWEQLLEVTKNGIDIGAHSHSHTILSSVDLVMQEKEISISKAIIEEKLGINVRSMSYPVGNYYHFTEDTKQIVKKAGYDIAFSFLTGINKYVSMDRMDVKRISGSKKFFRFACEIKWPSFFCDDYNGNFNE